jgi:hypothetical protein
MFILNISPKYELIQLVCLSAMDVKCFYVPLAYFKEFMSV